jgi:hypothetical protein
VKGEENDSTNTGYSVSIPIVYFTIHDFTTNANELL